MPIPTTTPLRIRYLQPEANPVDLGSGEIDRLGIITVTAPASGQAAYLAEVIGELNLREYVILKGVPLPRDAAEEPEEGASRPSPSKVKVQRGAAGFLAALKNYAQRVLGLELAFDEHAFELATLLDLGDEEPAAPPRNPPTLPPRRG